MFEQPFMMAWDSINRGGGLVGGWKELGRTTLGSNSSTITVTSIADKRYLKFLYSNLGKVTSSGFDELRVGNGSIDSGSNYANRISSNGGADSTNVSQTFNYLNGSSNQLPSFGVSYVANYSTKEKLFLTHSVNQSTAGAGTAPNARSEVAHKWVNTSNVIDQIQLLASAGSYPTGSEVVVLGWDPADVHTTNFWEQLYTGSGSAVASLNTSTITAKKYLWIQLMCKNDSGATNLGFQFNSDSSTNYAFRWSSLGGADSTNTSQTKIQANLTSPTTYSFINVFIINNSANEKLVILHEVNQGTVGAGNAPNRWEVVGKWANTSNQITSIQIVPSSGNITVPIFNVWGSD